MPRRDRTQPAVAELLKEKVRQKTVRVLVTGGLGYIGSHTVVELLLSKHKVLIIDNLENSKTEVLGAISSIANDCPEFRRVDIRAARDVDHVIGKFKPEAVIHFAAKKNPQASLDYPIDYYETNVTGTVNLVRSMMNCGVRKLVFSSSAAVYGNPEFVPVREDHRTNPITPYARTKEIAEHFISDVFTAAAGNSACILRYFNPVASHPSGVFHPHHPHGAPNLFPSLIRAAYAENEELFIHGTNFPTQDGTGVRDYIHVCDLALGHVAALRYAISHLGAEIFNLGTGKGYSVRHVIREFENTIGRGVATVDGPPRPGDPFSSFSNTDKAEASLNWKAGYGLRQMLIDEWKALRVADDTTVDR